MLQDWTKYETEVLEGHTGPPGTTSHTTWDGVVPDGDIGPLATTEDCSRPHHPFGDDYNPAITNAILAYHSWSTEQSIHLHTPHDDPLEWHPWGTSAGVLPARKCNHQGARHHQPSADGATTDTGATHSPKPNKAPRAPAAQFPCKEDKAHQQTRGPNLPAPPRPFNNSTSPSPHATSLITTKYPEGGTTRGARQKYGNYQGVTSIGRRSSQE